MSRHRGPLSHSLPMLPSTQGYLVGFFPGYFQPPLVPHRQPQGDETPRGNANWRHSAADVLGQAAGCSQSCRDAPMQAGQCLDTALSIPGRRGAALLGWPLLASPLLPPDPLHIPVCNLPRDSLIGELGRARGWAFPLDSEESKQEKC